MPTVQRHSTVRYSVLDRAKLWIKAGGDPHFALAQGVVSLAENVPGDPAKRNSIGATGLWQIYPGQPGSEDPLTNARQAVAKFNAARANGGTGFEPWAASKGGGGWGSVVNEKTGDVRLGSVRGIKIGKDIATTGGGGPGGILGAIPLPIPGQQGAGPNIPNPVDSVQAAIQNLVGPFQTIADTVSAIGDFLIHPKRLLKLIFGGVVLFWGISKLSGSFGGPQPAKRGSAIRKATVAVPQAKAVKTVTEVAKGKPTG